MSTTPREIGTLIVVVLKANHLPNKRHIGKQDPYCLVTHNGEKRRTKAIKRGGQHPEWDEEIRFTLYEDTVPDANTTPPPPPPKEGKRPKLVKGGWTMKIACFADDAREPDLIGEADVDLTEVLTKGETDEWFTLMNKDKFAGKVYLELTFWSNEPPPEKKITPKPVKSKQYGGPGSFVPSGKEAPSSLSNGVSHQSRAVSTSSVYEHPRQISDTIPASLRASSSLAKLDLYVPPYERSIDTTANEFGNLGISEHRRSESFPPLRDSNTPRAPSPNVYATISSHLSNGYDTNVSESSTYGYDNSSSHSPHHTRTSDVHYQAPYQPQYETQSSHPPPARGPRHSIPTSSSGFMPLPTTPAPVPLNPHPSEPSIFSGTPAVYNPSQFNVQPLYTSQTPTPDAYLLPSSSGTFVPQQSFPQSQSLQYLQYAPSTTPVPSILPLIQSPASTYAAYTPTHSSSLEAVTVSTLPHSSSVTSSFGIGPRPLPQQPQVVYGQPQATVLYAASSTTPQPISSFTPSQSGAPLYSSNTLYQPPPPPPPPPIQYTGSLSQPNIQPNIEPPPPPPPLPNSNSPSSTSRRQSSLPLPPTPAVYQQAPQPLYQQPPPPPPPPSDILNHPLPPPPTATLHHPLPPPPSDPSNHPLPQPPSNGSNYPLPPPPPPQLPSQNSPYLSGPLPNPPTVVDGRQWTSQADYNPQVFY
ncbi:hypothetical protein H0H92_004856 [Tricholoma furcatifolium]|nr:hypothetical protein H0H92_004856 [Tricholoma furcatifolium]